MLSFRRYSFLKDVELIKEDNQFLQYQFGIEPFSPPAGYAFAIDPKLSYQNYQDSPYTDFYARQHGLVQNVVTLMQQHSGLVGSQFSKADAFIEDLGSFKNLKILRIFENQRMKLDVFISFEYNNEEYFGVYKNFNYMMKPKLESELFYDIRNQYKMDQDYRLKLSNLFYKKIEKWFIPEKGWYKLLVDKAILKNDMGQIFEINKDKKVQLLDYNLNRDNEPYLTFKINGENYYIQNNDYYYFKWRFEKIQGK